MENLDSMIVKRKWRGRTSTYPPRIEQLCERLEKGEPAWRLANEWELTTSMVYHHYKAWRGWKFSEYRLDAIDAVG